MLTPSKLWPATALDVEVNAVAPTTGVATPLCFLLLPCSPELLRSAGASSPRRLSGSMMLLSGKAETVAGCGPEAPAAPANATAAIAARDKTTTACHKLFKCMLPPSVDLLPVPDRTDPARSRRTGRLCDSADRLPLRSSSTAAREVNGSIYPSRRFGPSCDLVVGTPQSGYSSFRHVRGSSEIAFGVRSSRKLK